MSTALAIDDFVAGWDLTGKLAVVAAFAQSVDEFKGMVEQAQIAYADPDLPDKRAATHKIVDYAYDAADNFIGDPTNVQGFVDALPPSATKIEALGILERFIPAGSIKDALLWVVDHIDEFIKFVLPFLLMILDGSPKVSLLKKLFRLPLLRAA